MKSFEARALRLPLAVVLAAMLGYAALWGQFNGMDFGIPQYLILHTVMEMASIVVAMLGAGIVWNAYASERPAHLVLLGVLLFGTGLLDFAHMLSVPGMPIMITPAEVQKSITFWLAARILPAIGLCISALGFLAPLKDERTRFLLAGGVLGYVVLVYWAALFHMDLLPVFYVPIRGLTASKVAFEYVLVAMYGGAAVLMLRSLSRTYNRTTAHLFMAAAIAALSELCFTLYRSHGDLFNLVGHLYKIVCYVFMYRAVFTSSVRQPFESLHAALDNERRMAARNRSIVRTLDLLEDAVLDLDAQGRLLNANAGWQTLLGAGVAADLPLTEQVHPQDRAAFEHQFQALLTGSKSELNGRFRFGTESQADKWVECRFVTESEVLDGAPSIRCVMRDITKVYLQERSISHMALHDALTGLPNRILLDDRISQAIQQASRGDSRVAICFIDLDHFKDVNDAFGHKVGDELLLGIVRRLRACLREGDTLSRWGGDEFVALLPIVKGEGVERQVAQKMLAATREPLEISGVSITTSFSMGIAVYPDDEPTGDTGALLAQADRAMFFAKSQGRNNFQFYAEISDKGTGKRDLYLQTKLAKAIHAGQIAAWFQPLIEARSALSESPHMKGIEVLARWHDEELGWVPPGTFIPIAESLGLIGELSIHVRRQGFDALRNWLQSLPDLKMSINVSKRQLFSADFIAELLADVQTYGLQPGNIILEITESVALTDVANADAHLLALAATGFTLSIDDFGTGYASLSQLHDLPIGELKIDISFVRRLHTEDGYRMVQGILGLAKALRLNTVAEGVEDLETAQLLSLMGVDLLQGYYFSRPCDAETLGQLPFFA
jgi:diguanylate cyclase (GGDEF)-like protein